MNKRFLFLSIMLFSSLIGCAELSGNANEQNDSVEGKLDTLVQTVQNETVQNEIFISETSQGEILQNEILENEILENETLENEAVQTGIMQNEFKGLFAHVEGQNIVDENGNLFHIKGMCFGNNVWANMSEPTWTHHDKESFQELEKLGFNTVRFYLNYKLFEDDNNPYAYKESAFEWLNQNIEWAREHNIKLILNMHVPQGGFMSAKSVEFWKHEENIKRYTSLWCELAKRYANEPVVLGYGLMNEPFLPKLGSLDESLDLYFDLIEKLASDIRKVDTKHILFIERPYGVVDNKNAVDYAWGDIGSFKCISDKNTVYEFHFYEYTNFTGQGTSWINYERKWSYGDDSIALLSGTRDYSNVCKQKSIADYDIVKGGWQYIESQIYDINMYEGVNAAYFLLDFSQLKKDSTVLIDDITVKEYDSNGRFIRDIYKYTFDSTTECSGWDLGTGSGGKCNYVNFDGNNALGCEMISDAGGQYMLYKNESLYNNFPVEKGNKYQVTLYMKSEGTQQPIVNPGLQLISSEKVYALDKEFLENKLLTYIMLGKENQVPIYIGEFGTTSHIMGNEFNGEKWVEDVLDIFNKYQINYSYHDYHEENYGLYTTPSTQKRTDKNEHLYSVFEAKVGK